ncbi:MAG: CGNR zinc finger domain-containing protein [Dehalococcoidia bacterium]
MLTPATGADTTVAPEPLRAIQELLNAVDAEPGESEIALATLVRDRYAAGVSQAALASDHGISQRLVSAIVRQRRLPDTSFQRHPLDGIADGATAAAWLAARGLLPAGAPPLTSAEHNQLIALRDAFRALALANNGQPGRETASAVLDQIAAAAPLVIVSEPNGPALVPAGVGFEAALARLLAIYFAAGLQGTWPRLKICPAHRCLWAFYDASKNQSRTWCSMAVCGNRAKAEAFQARRKATVPGRA